MKSMTNFRERIERLKRDKKVAGKKYKKCFPTDEEIETWCRDMDKWEKEQRDGNKRGGGWYREWDNRRKLYGPWKWSESVFRTVKLKQEATLYRKMIAGKPTIAEYIARKKQRRRWMLYSLAALIAVFHFFFFPAWFHDFSTINDTDKIKMISRVYSVAGIAKKYSENEKISDLSLKHNLSSSLYKDYIEGDSVSRDFVWNLKAMNIRTKPAFEIREAWHGKDIFGKEYGKVIVYVYRDNWLMHGLAWALGAYSKRAREHSTDKYTIFLVKEKGQWKIDREKVTNIADGICMIPRVAKLVISGHINDAADAYIRSTSLGNNWGEWKQNGIFIFDPKAEDIIPPLCLMKNSKTKRG